MSLESLTCTLSGLHVKITRSLTIGSVILREHCCPPNCLKWKSFPGRKLSAVI